MPMSMLSHLDLTSAIRRAANYDRERYNAPVRRPVRAVDILEDLLSRHNDQRSGDGDEAGRRIQVAKRGDPIAFKRFGGRDQSRLAVT